MRGKGSVRSGSLSSQRQASRQSLKGHQGVLPFWDIGELGEEGQSLSWCGAEEKILFFFFFFPTIISSSVAMTAGIDQKETNYPQGLPHQCKAGSRGGRKRKGEGCCLMDMVLGDSARSVLGAHQIALMCIIIKLSEPSLQLCSEAGSAENILSHFQMTFYAR